MDPQRGPPKGLSRISADIIIDINLLFNFSKKGFPKTNQIEEGVSETTLSIFYFRGL